MTNDKNTVAGVVFDESAEITIVELCKVCSVDRDTIDELVAEGILEPPGRREQLPYSAVKRTRTVVHMRRDLGVNLAGAALALDLLERIEELRAQLRRG